MSKENHFIHRTRAKRFDKPRIAIAGSEGFIGSRLTKSIPNEAYNITDVPRHLIDRRMENFVRDPKERFDLIFNCLKDCDFLINLAHSSYGSNARHPDHLATASFSESLEITAQLSTVAAKAKCVTIYISSGGTVYGNNLTHLTREDAQCEPTNMYGFSKQIGEQILSHLHMHNELNYIILRVSNIYGPGRRPKNGQGVISYWIDSAIREKPLELLCDSESSADYIYISDVIQAILKTIETFKAHTGRISEIINIGSGEASSLSNIIDILASHFPGIKIIYCKEVLKSNHTPRKSCLDISKAQKLLGWKPQVDLHEGIHRTIEWFTQS
ncbi:NAD-dependent epimerase/dehydratase family protein [Microcystis elabens FACHB-917]|nr:NAD-dependent epimerase/dehydratase family protein [Microcystis elabens FACHB-917]